MKTLEYKITDIPQEQMYYERIKLDAKEIGLEIDDVEFISPIECSVNLIRERNIIYASVEAELDVQLICRRCLSKYKTRISTHFDYQYEKTDEPEKLRSEFLSSIDRRYYMENTINLTEDVRQAIVLEIPLWPLCSEECKGLCPKCGHNLNEGTCSCELDILPPGKSRPFAALSDLIENTKEEEV